MDTGRSGHPVLGFGFLRRPTANIHVSVSRYFPHPVGRFRQYDGDETLRICSK